MTDKKINPAQTIGVVRAARLLIDDDMLHRFHFPSSKEMLESYVVINGKSDPLNSAKTWIDCNYDNLYAILSSISILLESVESSIADCEKRSVKK